MNCISSDKKSIINNLMNGNDISLYIGGAREYFATTNKKEIIYIKRRKGIFDICIKTQSILLPYYTFGITQLYHHHSFLLFGYLLIFPHKVKLTTICGNPIIPIEGDTIDTLRARYIEEIERIYYKYNDKYGNGRTLNIY